jgi:hypothetical protein
MRSACFLLTALVTTSACELTKKDAPDAAALPVVTAAPAATTPAAPTAAAPADPGTVAPLGATSATPAAPGHPTATAHTDGGKTAPAADGGTAPAPTPTFTIPAIPGFDAGGFKPPPGFPSTLPTFPPPQQK